jgi:hypothetical protein
VRSASVRDTIHPLVHQYSQVVRGLALAVLAVILAGCAGGNDPRLSEREFYERTNALCLEFASADDWPASVSPYDFSPVSGECTYSRAVEGGMLRIRRSRDVDPVGLAGFGRWAADPVARMARFGVRSGSLPFVRLHGKPCNRCV